MSRLLPALIVLVLSFTIGCADEPMDAPEGTPPRIAGLSLAPTTLTAGQRNALTGTMLFADSEADVVNLGLAIELPDGSKQTPAPIDVSAAGATQGRLQINLTVMPPSAGTYHFEVWLDDAGGNESNRLQMTAQAQ